MKIKIKDISLKAILMSIGIGIWIIVLQNAGIIPQIGWHKNGVQIVYVEGGSVDANVSGSVDVDRVRGTVNIDWN